MTASTISSWMLSMSIGLGSASSSESSALTDRLLVRGDGGGVLSNLTPSSRLFGVGSESSVSAVCGRLSLLVGGWSSFGDAIDVGEDVRVLLLLLLLSRRARARFAARAALETGTCMPSEDRDSDFRRVL